MQPSSRPDPSSDSGPTPTKFLDPANLSGTFAGYTIIEQLGAGGMGWVYLAHDAKIDRRVALKIPKLSGSNAQSVRERFRREVRTAAAIEHPNICPIYEVDEFAGIPYMTMKFVSGKPLSHYIRDGKHWPIVRAVWTVRRLAEIVAAAHQKGIVHRDLKPSNVMIDDRNQLVVMDFGLAVRLDGEDDRLTNAGFALGTPAYMSPEQAEGATDRTGPPSDVYSLGVILYELLTGRRPFVGANHYVIAQHITMAPEVPSRHRSNLSATVEVACLRALAKSPSDRFPDCGSFAAELDARLMELGSPHLASPRRSRGGERSSKVHPTTEREAPPPLPMGLDQEATPRAVIDWDAENETASARMPDWVESERPTSTPPRGGTRPSARSTERGDWTEPDGTQRKAVVLSGTAIVSPGRSLSVGMIVLAICMPLLVIAAFLLRGIGQGDSKPEHTQAERDASPGKVQVDPKGVVPPAEENDTLVLDDFEKYLVISNTGKSTKQFLQSFAPGRRALWEAAAKRGSPRAMFLLSYCYQEGYDVEKDHEKCNELLKQAAAKGLGVAENNIGANYHNEIGFVRNYSKAVEWYRKAEARSIPTAIRNLGNCAAYGQGLSQDWGQARSYFQRAAAAGDLPAHFELGRIYQRGLGLSTPDLQAAEDYYRKGAEKGNLDCQVDLGALLLERVDAPEADRKRGREWVRKAAEVDFPRAQNYLGKLILASVESVKNPTQAMFDEAIGWLTRAVDQRVADRNTNREFRSNRAEGLLKRGLWHIGRDDTKNAYTDIAAAEKEAESLHRDVESHFKYRVQFGEVKYALGLLARKNGRLGDAEKELSSGSRLGARNASLELADVYGQLAEIFENKKEPKAREQYVRLKLETENLAQKQAYKVIRIECAFQDRDGYHPVEIFVTEDVRTDHPLALEEKRLETEERATIPNEVKREFKTALDEARRKQVPFLSLVDDAAKRASDALRKKK